ncbi:MAG: hypothetical protein AAGF49_10620, partial [Pseudomonadota bacterium]
MRAFILAALKGLPAGPAVVGAALLGASLVDGSSGSATAQSFQTALPVSPAERRVIESRLGTILDYSAPDEVNQFQLPSGRTVLVRPYRFVRRPGEQPCRGYRIDLRSSQSAIAVDGFRCKRSDGQTWAIVEPELVLAEEGPQIIPSDGPFELARTAEEPIYPADDDEIAVTAPPPIPRPAPRISRPLPVT